MAIAFILSLMASSGLLLGGVVTSRSRIAWLGVIAYLLTLSVAVAWLSR